MQPMVVDTSSSAATCYILSVLFSGMQVVLFNSATIHTTYKKNCPSVNVFSLSWHRISGQYRVFIAKRMVSTIDNNEMETTLLGGAAASPRMGEAIH